MQQKCSSKFNLAALFYADGWLAVVRFGCYVVCVYFELYVGFFFVLSNPFLGIHVYHLCQKKSH